MRNLFMVVALLLASTGSFLIAQDTYEQQRCIQSDTGCNQVIWILCQTQNRCVSCAGSPRAEYCNFPYPNFCRVDPPADCTLTQSPCIGSNCAPVFNWLDQGCWYNLKQCTTL